jgi:hypothetical protein
MVVRNGKDAMVSVWWDLMVCVWRDYGVWCMFYVGVFGRNLASKIFPSRQLRRAIRAARKPNIM